MQPALSQVCSLPSPFEKDVEDYAAGKCSAIEIWLTKLENFLKTHQVSDVLRLLDEHQMSAPVASLQGGILSSQGEARREAWELFAQRLELCRAIGTKTLVVACDATRPLTQPDIERVHVSLVQAAQQAGIRGLRIALEFQAGAGFGNNLQTAAALVAEVGSPHLGLCLDVFHYYLGPSKTDDLSYLTQDNLFHVQFSDLADVPRELATDSNRILPGDGDIPLAPIIHRLREIEYRGLVSVELLNPTIWQIAPRRFGEIAMTAIRKLLGLSSMN